VSDRAAILGLKIELGTSAVQAKVASTISKESMPYLKAAHHRHNWNKNMDTLF